MDPSLNLYFAGMVTAGYLACGLFFARFWARSRDFLFIAFAAAFWLLALHVALLVLIPGTDQHRVWVYLFRVVAFLLIAVAIVRKNAGTSGAE